MKIQISEEQLKRLVEENVSYTPEKIDALIQEAMKLLEEVQQARNTHMTNVIHTTIAEVMLDKESYQKEVLKIEADHKMFNVGYEKYYNIIETFDWMDQPDNVKKLEKINEKIYKYNEDIYQTGNALEEIISASLTMERTK